MNKKILIIVLAIFIIIIAALIIVYLFLPKDRIIGGEVPCGGWDMLGETVCDCSGKLTVRQCPEGMHCDKMLNSCLGTCSNCKCYQGDGRGIEVSCENRTLLRLCPDQWIDETGWRNITGNMSTSSSEYFILNGERRELSEFDVDWVKINCDIEPLIAE